MSVSAPVRHLFLLRTLYKVTLELSGGSRIFPRGCTNSQIETILQFFCQKLHENERIWTLRGCTSLVPLLDPPMELLLITARKRSLQRLCFHRCLSVHGGWWQGGMHGGGHAWQGVCVAGEMATTAGGTHQTGMQTRIYKGDLRLILKVNLRSSLNTCETNL